MPLLRPIFLLILLALPFTLVQAATVTIFAAPGENVADINFDQNGPLVPDGLGDETALLNYPWIGAGINLSGAAGNNGTARFQLEFNITGVVGPITSAILFLDSAPSMNNTLDTTLFHLTGDEDGVATANDFQSAAVSTGIVQPVVFPAATYQFDLTSFVQQDLIAGFVFTSYQGRVNEAAGATFLRGMEFLSAAPLNGNGRPRLVVETAVVPEPSSVWLMATGLGAGLAFLARRRG